MPGISTAIISHKLGIDPAYRPVRQKRRVGDQERYEAMKAEVDKLLSMGFIREVQYPRWLANPVLVNSADGEVGQAFSHSKIPEVVFLGAKRSTGQRSQEE